MERRHLTTGLVLAIVAACSFGLSGAFVKPLLEAGWSPVAAVALRALVGGLILAPVALVQLRGDLRPVLRAWRRVLGMALVGVAGAQVMYFAAIERIPVGTAILIEFMAPLLLVAVAWAMTRRRPAVPVLLGSVAAAGGLALVVSPSGGGALDPVGLLFALGAMVGCAGYFAIAARGADGLPPVALAAAGLLVAAVLLALVGVTGILPFTGSVADVVMLGSVVPWWVPMLVVGVVATGLAYGAGITAGAMLGSRLASFTGLLEVAAAGAWAWLLLGEALTALQLVGGALIVAGIVAVRFDARADALPTGGEAGAAAAAAASA
ncbi:EamA family transporter [Clavibacter michiganensis]|uniref:EamA family transporter n=1 Tax=Clavibacter michiganensis TaxID=28447 RepID=UPI0013666B7F|nr:DMT family transporter [Clavibacter michiganensis]MDO4018004.1 DMT family transporter [Clavibacter michiganensis]MDO4025106.1 DMT family transporter [Clavibacter michiganensis]MDO4033764.1 DMT family transporter [Clavibacter michiganensis]MDO4037665.1 DMT family transporter [Clavibacter michiganensis]MDO4046965.1 DMT family transporter [Clavibacter michiganensis]